MVDLLNDKRKRKSLFSTGPQALNKVELPSLTSGIQIASSFEKTSRFRILLAIQLALFIVPALLIYLFFFISHTYAIQQ